VRVNTVLGNDSSATGRLVVKGDTSGSSTVRVTNVGGAGAPTVEGIKIIDVQGASNGTFALAGDYTFQGQQAVVAGPYAYRLVKHGVSTSTDGGWYLRSSIVDTPAASSEMAAAAAAAAPLLAPTVPVYEAYASVLQRFNEPGTLQQRVGNRSWSPNAAVPAEQEAGKPLIGRGVWARAEGSNVHVDPSTSTTSASYNTRMWKFEAGVDAPVYLGDAAGAAGTLVVGPTFHYGVANANVSSMFGQGAIDATGYGFGANATWYGTNGSYIDARATVSWYDTDLRSSTLGTRLANNNRGNGVAASLEAGHRLPLGGSWSVTPQAQLAWSQVRFDAFTDQYGATVSRDNGNSLVSRLGVSLDHETTWTGGNGKTRRSHVYGITNLYYDFLNGTSAHVANLSVVSKEQALWAGLGIGASMNWDDDRYTVYGELVARTSLQDFGDSNAVSARLGVRYRW
jgi:fibronectin-binding autotransporter adhesin